MDLLHSHRSIFGHNHRACRVVFGSSLNRSQNGLSIMVRRTKFTFVGTDSRQAVHSRFLTLFGTCKDQITFPKSLSLSEEVLEISWFASFFKKRYLDLHVYSPFYGLGQNRLSSATTLNKGSFLMSSASSGVIMPSIIL